MNYCEAVMTFNPTPQQRKYNNYKNKMIDGKFSSLNSHDMVFFWRDYYSHRIGYGVVNENFMMSAKVFKELITNHGSAKTMDIIACSLESYQKPNSVKYFSGWNVNRILDSETFEELKGNAQRYIVEFLDTFVE